MLADELIGHKGGNKMSEAEARAALVRVLATHTAHEAHDAVETAYVTIGCWAIDAAAAAIEMCKHLMAALAEALKPLIHAMTDWWQDNGADAMLCVALPDHVAGLERLALPALPAPKMPPLLLQAPQIQTGDATCGMGGGRR